MDRDENSKQRLIAPDEDEKIKAPTVINFIRTQIFYSSFLALFGLAFLSILLNIILSVELRKEQARRIENSTPFSTIGGRSAYTGLALDTPTVHHHHTPFWDENTTVSDAMWESIDTDPMVVALQDSFADAHRLPRSQRFPWDHGKGRYFIKVFHQLHCLKFVRRAFADYERGHLPKLDGRHVHHCLDSLRQDIICIADDTPMPTGEEARAIGDDQKVMCRNFDKLVDWIYAPERNACHRALDDYRSITHSIERYAFCGKASPYFDVMTKYFQSNGHSDPWS